MPTLTRQRAYSLEPTPSKPREQHGRSAGARCRVALGLTGRWGFAGPEPEGFPDDLQRGEFRREQATSCGEGRANPTRCGGIPKSKRPSKFSGSTSEPLGSVEGSLAERADWCGGLRGPASGVACRLAGFGAARGGTSRSRRMPRQQPIGVGGILVIPIEREGASDVSLGGLEVVGEDVPSGRELGEAIKPLVLGESVGSTRGAGDLEGATDPSLGGRIGIPAALELLHGGEDPGWDPMPLLGEGDGIGSELREGSVYGPLVELTEAWVRCHCEHALPIGRESPKAGVRDDAR